MTREFLIQAGIKNLKQFGYPNVTQNNIVTDMIYGQFFKRMLEETRDAANPCFAEGASILSACQGLIDEINLASKS